MSIPEQIVKTVWSTPEGDDLIGYMARVSNPKAKITDPAAKLIGFLIDNHHWSPFAMVNLCLEINTTRDISAQILRHKSADFQEFSTRYADVEELLVTAECRFQDDKNRQNSFEATEDDARIVDWWDKMVGVAAENGMADYKIARQNRIAKEVARRVLPIGLIPTKLYMNGTVRTWIHYLNERTKPGVQKEHRAVALAAQVEFERLFPNTFKAVMADREKTRKKDKLYDLFISGKLAEIVFHKGLGHPDDRLAYDSLILELELGDTK